MGSTRGKERRWKKEGRRGGKERREGGGSEGEREIVRE
jgi:hypothetical protein